MPMVGMPHKGELHNLKDIVRWIVVKRGGRRQAIPIRPKGPKNFHIDKVDTNIESRTKALVDKVHELPRDDHGFLVESKQNELRKEIQKDKDVMLNGAFGTDAFQFQQALAEASPLAAEALNEWGGHQPEMEQFSPRGALGVVALGWKFNGRAVGGSLFQLMAAKVMGISDPKLFFTRPKNKERLEAFVKFFAGTKFMQNMEIGVRALYAESQEMLKSSPGNTLELWRGVQSKYNVTSTAESWAEHKDTAERYDDAGVFKVPIEKKSILVHAKSKIWLSTHDPSTFFDEGDEWVVVGAKWTPAKNPTAKKIETKRDISDESKRTLFALKKMSAEDKKKMLRSLK